MDKLILYYQKNPFVWHTIAVAFFLYLLLIFLRVQRKKQTQKSKVEKTRSTSLTPPTKMITSQDIKAISGGDVLATQLDLARAYIEMGKKSLAKKILLHVSENGTPLQQQIANQLISTL